MRWGRGWISYGIIFETSKYIYRNGYCVAVDCKSEINLYKFPRKENLKQQWLIKIKQKYPVDTTRQNVSYLLLRLKSLLENDATSAGPK